MCSSNLLELGKVLRIHEYLQIMLKLLIFLTLKTLQLLSDNTPNMITTFSQPGFEARLFPVREEAEDMSEESGSEDDMKMS